MNQMVVAKSLTPRTLEEAMAFATMLSKSTMVPRDFQGKPENIIVAVQWGAEVGLGPLQALQNIAVINGRPSIFGDAALALVQGSGLCEEVKEWIEGEGDNRVAHFETKRKGRATLVKQKFAVADAKRANLWGKQGPWTQYPERMLQMRARSFGLRDAYPDVLKGVILAEEAQDIPNGEPKNVTPQGRGNPLRQEFQGFSYELSACNSQEQIDLMFDSPEFKDFEARDSQQKSGMSFAGMLRDQAEQMRKKLPEKIRYEGNKIVATTQMESEIVGRPADAAPAAGNNHSEETASESSEIGSGAPSQEPSFSPLCEKIMERFDIVESIDDYKAAQKFAQENGKSLTAEEKKALNELSKRVGARLREGS